MRLPVTTVTPHAPFPVDSASRRSFTFGDMSHDVFSDGDGPSVLLLHELPGMTPACLRLAAIIRDAGYEVTVPLLFGTPGQHHAGAGALLDVARICLRREFRLLATNGNAPITAWLRALCRDLHERTSRVGAGIGVIGMCLTGNVVLSLMLEESVLVPVTCEPSLPFEMPWLPGAAARRAAAGVPDDDFAKAASRAQSVPLFGYRFQTDTLCRAERFQTISEKFGTSFHRREIPTGPANPGNIPAKAHSVLTEYFVDEPSHPTRAALDEILAECSARLRRSSTE